MIVKLVTTSFDDDVNVDNSIFHSRKHLFWNEISRSEKIKVNPVLNSGGVASKKEKIELTIYSASLDVGLNFPVSTEPFLWSSIIETYDDDVEDDDGNPFKLDDVEPLA